MPNLNMVQLMGNLTRDPEVKYTPKGTAVAGFGMAINRVWSNEGGQKMEEVTFVDVEFWGKQAEILSEYTKKGHPLYVQGRLKLDTWDDKTSGQKRSKLRVVGESFQFLKGKGDGEGGYQPKDEDAPSTGYGYGASSDRKQSGTFRPPPQKPVDPDLDGDDLDIPF
jgi:single-strand DNA-binding protein